MHFTVKSTPVMLKSANGILNMCIYRILVMIAYRPLTLRSRPLMDFGSISPARSTTSPLFRYSRMPLVCDKRCRAVMAEAWTLGSLAFFFYYHANG